MARKHEDERVRLFRERENRKKAAEDEGNELVGRRREKQLSEKVLLEVFRKSICSRWRSPFP